MKRFEKMVNTNFGKTRQFLMLAALALLTPQAGAVQVHFTGVIYQSNSMSGEVWGLEPLFPIGSLFSGQFNYDPLAALTSSYTTPSGSISYYGGGDFVVSLGAITVRPDKTGIAVVDGGYVGEDLFSIRALGPIDGISIPGSPYPATSMLLALRDTSATIYSAATLPSSLSANGFDELTLSIDFFRPTGIANQYEGYVVSGAVTSLSTIDSGFSVSEPSSYALVAFGVLGLLGFRRMRDC